jgi:hypothetical protein
MSAFNHLEFVKAHRFIAIDPCFIDGKVNRPTLTIGKEYAITISDEEGFFVIDDEGDGHQFTWDEYTKWFRTKPKEEQVDPLRIKETTPFMQWCIDNGGCSTKEVFVLNKKYQGEEFIPGDRVVLDMDDGTEMPRFALESDRSKTQYIFISEIGLVKDAEPTVDVHVPSTKLFDVTNSDGIKAIFFEVNGIRHCFTFSRKLESVVYASSNKADERLTVEFAMVEINNLISLKQAEIDKDNPELQLWNANLKALEEKYAVN